MEFLDSLSGCELVLLSSVIAISLSQGLTPDEADTLGNFLSSIGSNLSTIATSEAEDVIV